MFEIKRPLEEAILALRYPKIAIEYVKGLNKYHKYRAHDLYYKKKIESYQKTKVQLGVGGKDQLKLLPPRNLKSPSRELSFNIRRFLYDSRGVRLVTLVLDKNNTSRFL